MWILDIHTQRRMRAEINICTFDYNDGMFDSADLKERGKGGGRADAAAFGPDHVVGQDGG